MSPFRSSTVLAACALTFVLATGLAKALPSVHLVAPPGDGIVADAEIDAAGAVHLAYVSLPDGVEQDLFYAVSNDGGETFGEPVRINANAGQVYAGGFRGPDIALGANGRVHVIWYTNGYQAKRPREEWGVHYAYMDAGGDAFVGERNINKRPSDNYSLDANDAGEVSIYWGADAGYISRSSDGGETFAEAVHIASIDPCECCATRARYADDGTLHLAYREKADNLRDMYIVPITESLSSPPHVKLDSEPWEIAMCPMTGSYLAASDAGSYLVAWERKRAVYYGRYGKDGSPIEPAEVAVVDDGRYPLVLSGSEGVALVAWKDDVRMGWRQYDAKGLALGDATVVETDNIHRFGGIVTPAGDFVIFP
jgi:hypothetical protein